jgi:hypothetical protein
VGIQAFQALAAARRDALHPRAIPTDGRRNALTSVEAGGLQAVDAVAREAVRTGRERNALR